MAKMGRPKTDNPKSSSLKVSFTKDELDRLKEYASRHDITVSEMVRRGINVQIMLDDSKGNYKRRKNT